MTTTPSQPVAAATAAGPEELWLQLYGDSEPDDGPLPDYTTDEVTWCWHSIFEHDVRYVREDLAPLAAPAGEPACWYCGSAQEDECQGPLEVLCQRRRVAVVAGDGSEPAAWMRGPSTTSTSPVAITHWAKLNHGAKDAGGPGYTAEYTIPLYAAPRAPAPDAAPNLHPEHDAMIAEAEEFAQNNGSKDVRVFARNTARYLRALAALADGAAAPADEPERRP